MDSASYAILYAFRDGEFIIEGKGVLIEMCVNNEEYVSEPLSLNNAHPRQ